jgi:hypothetical protein
MHDRPGVVHTEQLKTNFTTLIDAEQGKTQGHQGRVPEEDQRPSTMGAGYESITTGLANRGGITLRASFARRARTILCAS